MRVGILLLFFIACGRAGAETNGPALAAATNAQARAAAPVPVGVAVSFKDTLGRAYTNATVTRVEPGCLVLMTADGVVQLPAMVLPEDIKERFQIERPGAAAPRTAAAVSTASPPASAAAPAVSSPGARVTARRSGGGVGQGALRKGLTNERPVGGGAIKVQASVAAGGGALSRQPAAVAAGGGAIAKPVISDGDAAGMFEAIGRVQGMAQAGQLESAASALAQLQDQHSPSAIDPAGKDRFAETSMDVFDRSRKLGEFAVARSALETAVNMHAGSARIMDRVLVLFDEADAAFDEGKFPDALRQVELTEGVGLDRNILVLRKRRELANAALASGWSAAFSLDLPRAAAAIAAARKLWPENPSLVWFDRIVASLSLLAILAALVISAKVFGKKPPATKTRRRK